MKTRRITRKHALKLLSENQAVKMQDCEQICDTVYLMIQKRDGSVFCYPQATYCS